LVKNVKKPYFLRPKILIFWRKYYRIFQGVTISKISAYKFGKKFPKTRQILSFLFFFKNFVELLCNVDLKHSPKKFLNFFGHFWQ